VSSGAIALGRKALNLSPGKLRLEESQALPRWVKFVSRMPTKSFWTRTKSRSRKFS